MEKRGLYVKSFIHSVKTRQIMCAYAHGPTGTMCIRAFDLSEEICVTGPVKKG